MILELSLFKASSIHLILSLHAVLTINLYLCYYLRQSYHITLTLLNSDKLDSSDFSPVFFLFTGEIVDAAFSINVPLRVPRYKAQHGADVLYWAQALIYHIKLFGGILKRNYPYIIHGNQLYRNGF